MNMAVITPCVRNSELVCCLGDSALARRFCDSDTGHRRALLAADMRRSLAKSTPESVPLNRLHDVAPGALDFSTYFDNKSLHAFGVSHYSPRMLGYHLSYLKQPCLTTTAQAESIDFWQESTEYQVIMIHDASKGIFTLQPKESFPTKRIEDEAAHWLWLSQREQTTYPLRIAGPLYRTALHFIQNRLGNDYDALLWRAELSDQLSANACTKALLAHATHLKKQNRTLLLLGDIRANATALWRHQPSRLTVSTLHRLFDLGVEKFDHDAHNTLDLGALGLIDQVLAAHAKTLYSQRSDSLFLSGQKIRRGKNTKKFNTEDFPYRVRVGPCGWEGRFLTTVLAARAAVNKPSLSWTEPYLFFGEGSDVAFLSSSSSAGSEKVIRSRRAGSQIVSFRSRPPLSD